MRKLTGKQEKFAQGVAEGLSHTDAYRAAYNAENMKPLTIKKRASELMANGAIAGTINELKAAALKRHAITVDDLIKELEEARKVAKETAQAGAMTGATMGKAKLLGLDKQLVEVTERKVKVEWIRVGANHNH